MRVNAMVDGELMGFEGDAAKVIKARDDEIGVLRHVIEALEEVMAERKPIAISRECAEEASCTVGSHKHLAELQAALRHKGAES